MGDDSERADRASDGESSGDGEPGSAAAGTPTDTDAPASDPPDRSDDDSTAADSDGDTTENDSANSDSDTTENDSADEGPTEVDAAETVERLRAGGDGGDTDESTDGPSDGDADEGDTNGNDTDESQPPPDVPAIDPDGTSPGPGFESVDPQGGGDANGEAVDADGTSNGDTDDDESDGIWPDDRGAPADAAEVTGTDGGTPATAGDAATGAGAGTGSEDSLVDDGLVSDGPDSDEEMPLADHIEEMIHRLAVVLGIGGIITLLLYPGADLANSAFGLDLVSSTEVIDFLWNKHVPGAPELTDRRPRVYGPLELLLTELKVAALGGLVVGLPVFVYETYLFMRPGLYPKERRYYLAAVPTSIVLAFVGISFAHFIVLPAIFAYFTSYTTGTAIVAFGLKETFNLILILMAYNAIIFQIPLFIMLAIMMNLVTRTWLEDRRLLFWGAFLGLAFLISPDPTGMAPIIIGATMIALFEGTLLALRWTASGSFVLTSERLAARRPHAVVFAALVGYLLSPLPAPAGYYDLLPSVVVGTLTANGLAVYTPLLVAGALVGVFELVSVLLRRFGRSRRLLRARLAVDTARRPVWLVAVVVGYLGSPDPVVLRWVTELTLRPVVAGGVAVGLVLGYEALRLLLAAREDRAA
jgi:sec-independent protein translocase protein TatC